MIGLPGETIRIKHGDIYVKRPGSEDFRLERKPLKHQLAMQMLVYDDRYRPKAMADSQEWLRWRPATPGGWKNVDPGKVSTSARPKQAKSGLNWATTICFLIPSNGKTS